MYNVLDKKVLVEDNDRRIFKFTIVAPLIAAKALAGQFVVLMVNGQGKWFPLTVADKDARQGKLRETNDFPLSAEEFAPQNINAAKAIVECLKS